MAEFRIFRNVIFTALHSITSMALHVEVAVSLAVQAEFVLDAMDCLLPILFNSLTLSQS